MRFREYLPRAFSILRDICQIAGAVLLLITAGHFALGGLNSIRTLLTDDPPPEFTKSLPYISPALEAGIDRFVMGWENKQTKAEPRRYYYWKRKPFDGTYSKVDSLGNRRTAKPDDWDPKDESRKKIFILGGSTTWGIWGRDETTIPSYFQALVGNAYEVFNLSDPGWVSTQELLFLMERLAAGDVPDIVIFYNGYNDGYAGTYSPAIPREPRSAVQQADPEPAIKNVSSALYKAFQTSNYGNAVAFIRERFLPRPHSTAKWDEEIAPSVKRNAVKTIDMYEANMKQARALGAEYEFEVYFFWQPNLHSKTKNQLTNHQELALSRTSPVLAAGHFQVYREAKKRLSGHEADGVFFLGHVFDDVRDEVYLDNVHTGPRGNEIIAEQIHKSLMDKL